MSGTSIATQMDINGRTAIITGASSGIGRALALEFARHGARVVCCARRKERLTETVEMIEAEGGVGLAVPTDVTAYDQVRHLIGETIRKFGFIDVLFNNAGSFQSIAGAYELDHDVWWHDVEVNLYGSMLLMREVLPHMLARDEGIIINMDGGRPPGGSGYACSKAALMELTRLLVEELSMINSSVMVFSAAPSLVRTEMTELQAYTPAGLKWFKTRERFETGRVRRPEDIARATMRLIDVATPASSGKRYDPDTDFSSF